MTTGVRGPFLRLTCAAAIAMSALAVNVAQARIGAASPLACAHLRATYWFGSTLSFGMTNPISVGSSLCSAGGTAVNTTGSGTVTLLEAGGALGNSEFDNHYDLDLNVGGTAVHTVFDVVGPPVGPGVDPLQEVVDYDLVGPVGFANATGSGLLNEHCTFSAAWQTHSCVDDAAFVAD